MSVLNQSGEEQVECPLCMEPLEVDDLNFFPCTCGYQICRFCWHRIRTDENGLCPACRKGYPENPADFKPLSQEEVAKLKAEKRHKDQQRKQKVTENRKHLANVRVVQRNLVFVVGLPMRLADSEVLKKHEYFGKFGKIHKVVINQCTSYAGTQGPSASAYVTYQRGDDALRAIQAVNNISVDGRSVKSSLGTTKYCSHFMKNQSCPKPDCMYLHEQGDTEASFTKEEMQQGKHQEYEKKLHDALISASGGGAPRKPTPSPPAVAASPSAGAVAVAAAAAAAAAATSQSQAGVGKEAWPSLQPGTNGATGNGGANGTAVTNGNNTGGKGENGRKQNCTKGGNAKKRHTSPEQHRGKSKELLAELSEPEPEPESCDDDAASSLDARSTDSTDSSDESCGLAPPQAPPPRIGTALFEPDNNSFFSANSFTKLASTALGSGIEWTANGLSAPHMPDSLMPTVHPTEDWQAAFGFVARPPSPPAAARHPPPAAAGGSGAVPFDGAHHFHFPGGHGAAHLPAHAHYRQRFSPVSNGGGGGPAASKFFSDYHTQRDFGSPEPAFTQRPDFPPSNVHMDYNPRYDPLPRSYAEYREDPPPTTTAAAFAGFHRGPDSPAAPAPSAVSEQHGATDDWGFDLFHETQKALAEMMEKEAGGRFYHGGGGGGGGGQFQTPSFGGSKLMAGFGGQTVLAGQQQQQQHLHQQQQQTQNNHRPASGCSRLLDGLGLGPSSRPRLPPPGFGAPNHMNAFGLGIPRSKFAAAGVAPAASNAAASNVAQQQQMYPPPTLPAFNGSKDWAENLRTFPTARSGSPPSRYAPNAAPTQHSAGPAKGWTGPCTDWTALDPAIVSSSRPAGLPPASAFPPSAAAAAAFPSAHWLRRLEEQTFYAAAAAAAAASAPLPPPAVQNGADWASAPPPGFGVRQAAKVGDPKMENL